MSDSSSKVSRRATIVNDLGVHLRAAGALVQEASLHACEIYIERDGTRANAKSIMSVLSLAATKGTEIEVVAEGDGAEAAVDALCNLIARGFHD